MLIICTGDIMKKILMLLLIIVILMLVSCASDIVRSGGVVEHSTPEPTADVDEAYDADEIIVYITKSGTKYHREDCCHLKKSKIPISLEQAKERGLEPCSVCNPPE